MKGIMRLYTVKIIGSEPSFGIKRAYALPQCLFFFCFMFFVQNVFLMVLYLD